MKANYSFVNTPAERVIRLRMTGEFDVRAMERWSEAYRRVTREYSGRRHMVLADMRGTAPLEAQAAEIFGEAIAFSRRNGVVCCAHLSDNTVQKLQAARLGRSIDEYDDITVDVVSVDEAERLFAERLPTLDG